ETALYGDDFTGRLHLPFPFSFYGTDYDQVFISDNGYINFLGPDLYNPFPLAIPSEAPPNAAIYALWRDLSVTGESVIAYRTTGTAPSRVFSLEFTDVNVRGTTATVDFEIKLHEEGEIVDILYGDNP